MDTQESIATFVHLSPKPWSIHFDHVHPAESANGGKPELTSHSQDAIGAAAHDKRISRLHYLVPASLPTLQLCYNLVSSSVNGYPVPTLLGFNGQGEFDAGATHLAKLRTLTRYLASLGSEDDDDLAVVVDAYDIIHQLPAEVIIERYFDIAAKADEDLASRYSVSVEGLRELDIRQTIFWGPDKLCWPPDPVAARCWAAPSSPFDRNAFGFDLGLDEVTSAPPRWLNSGTVIGPVRDLRRLMEATAAEIEATYDSAFWQSDSDQFYVANVWGRQEYWRDMRLTGGSRIPDDPEELEIPRVIPEGGAEFHTAIEYESSLFQLKAGNEPFLNFVEFNETNHHANVNTDMFGPGKPFESALLGMPSNVRKALIRRYESIPKDRRHASSADWIRTVQLGVNLVTKHIYGLWHCTGMKEFVDTEYPKMWFYPYVSSLLKSAVKATQREEFISPKPLSGRWWAPKGVYPLDKPELVGEFGGAWSDEVFGGKFVPWQDLCGMHEAILFGGDDA